MVYVSPYTPEERAARRKASRRRYLSSEKGRANSNAQSLRWRAANPEKYAASLRRHDLKRYYGLTPEEHAAMFLDQGSCCAACGGSDPGRKSGDWSTDHDHATGKVRGILCNGCNVTLGHMKDDPARLERLAAYLRQHGGGCEQFKT